MSSFREKIERKKNKYLEAAKNIGKGSKSKKEEDDGSQESTEYKAIDEAEDASVPSPSLRVNVYQYNL